MNNKTPQNLPSLPPQPSHPRPSGPLPGTPQPRTSAMPNEIEPLATDKRELLRQYGATQASPTTSQPSLNLLLAQRSTQHLLRTPPLPPLPLSASLCLTPTSTPSYQRRRRSLPFSTQISLGHPVSKGTCTASNVASSLVPGKSPTESWPNVAPSSGSVVYSGLVLPPLSEVESSLDSNGQSVWRRTLKAEKIA